MKTRHLVLASSIYGLAVGIAIATKGITLGMLFKSLLVVVPPVAAALFIRDTQHHQNQRLSQCQAELREARKAVLKILRSYENARANEFALYDALARSRQELVSCQQQLRFLREQTAIALLEDGRWKFKNIPPGSSNGSGQR